MSRITAIVSKFRPGAPESALPQPPIALPEGTWVGLDYPRRIPPLTRRELPIWQRLFLTAIRIGADETYDYTCFGITGRLGKVFPLHTIFFTQLLQHGRIPKADSERIVIRVAARRRPVRVRPPHPDGIGVGGAPRRSRIAVQRIRRCVDPRTRALMEATDELLRTKNLSPVTFEALRRELDQDQIVEFAMLVGHYVMGGMALSVAGCEIEPAFRLDEPAPARA